MQIILVIRLPTRVIKYSYRGIKLNRSLGRVTYKQISKNLNALAESIQGYDWGKWSNTGIKKATSKGGFLTDQTRSD